MSDLLLVVIGLAVLGGFSLLYVKISRAGRNEIPGEVESLKKQAELLETDKQVAMKEISILQQQAAALAGQVKEKDTTILELNREISKRTAEFDALSDKLKQQKSEIDLLQEKFRIEFRNLANEILEEKTLKFTELNKTRLDELLKPLGEKIRDFEKKVDETYDKESKQRFSLEKEIKSLAELNQQISQDARNLTTALKSDTKKQGNWGELVLERVLESSGLVKGQEYIREFSTKTDNGEVFRPDVIVNLPDNKHIIVDAKVSLLAYNDFVNAESQEERDRNLKLHILSIKNHVKLLSEKTYQNLEAFDTPDYVLLFIPIESSFSLALQSDPELFSYAWEKNVVIVSPTTLLATLKTVASIWKHEKQTQNAIKIAREGGLLYDKFVSFLNDLEKIGNQLDATKRIYDEAHRKLSTGSGNIIGKVEKLKEMGAKASKEIPKTLLEKSGEEDT
ncbi:MAG: DNA recombination protein RmuC [bacterium]